MGTFRLPILAGVMALLVGILSISITPLTDLIIQKSLIYNFPLPFLSQPTVFDPVRDITYHGSFSSARIENFHNIFYALEPSGARRFAPPVPLEHAAGSVIDATTPGAWCPQGTGDVLPFTSRVTNVSENCLSLRIARSRGVKAGDNIPVVVWMHGGGHALGSAEEVLYRSDGFVEQATRDRQPVLFVGFNYRLGVFGFATGEALINLKHTNAGLRDQRAAFEWVRDNIHAFGGDPQRVTAIGQSVGASDISLQLTAFGGERGVPFQQAMMMSGGPGLNFNTKSQLVAEKTAAVAKQIGCTEKDNDESEEVLNCLRNVPFEAISNISVPMARSARPPFGEGFFYPTYDNDFVIDRPTESMRNGRFVKGIPIIISWVTNDGAWYAPPSTASDEDVLNSFGLWIYNLSKETNAKLLELYPVSAFEHMAGPGVEDSVSPQYYRAAQMNRDIWFTCPVLDFAWQYVKRGGVGADQLWVYEHNATRFAPAYEIMGVPMWRVAHLSDIPYVLNNLHMDGPVDNSAAQLALGLEMSRAVVRFVNHGSPEGEVMWPAAFRHVSSEELDEDSVKRFTMKLFGGPHGSQYVAAQENRAADELNSSEQAVDWEQLFKRCEFINSPKFREEAGV
ncbi:alpha/beta-hydrolase [Penicillium angulare]|uniref:alpha/beta-hydrolase n=1 Tax=Penicillium angulare TaxID=116970 RepID=UPI0025424B34|nr:alpha/beta-hydrolase [Penicillium angulare]KAJ5280742.1 alpha/beta-hydrolase [Penicillium angulare]